MIRRRILHARRRRTGYGENLAGKLASGSDICKPIEFLLRHQGSAWRLPLSFEETGVVRANTGLPWRVRRCSYRACPIGSAEERVRAYCSRASMWSSQLGGTYCREGQTKHRGTTRHDSVKEAPGTTTAFRIPLARAPCAAGPPPPPMFDGGGVVWAAVKGDVSGSGGRGSSRPRGVRRGQGEVNLPSYVVAVSSIMYVQHCSFCAARTEERLSREGLAGSTGAGSAWSWTQTQWEKATTATSRASGSVDARLGRLGRWRSGKRKPLSLTPLMQVRSRPSRAWCRDEEKKR